MLELGRFSRNQGEGSRVSPSGDKRLVVETRAEDGGFEGFVVFTTDDKLCVEEFLDVKNGLSGELVMGCACL